MNRVGLTLSDATHPTTYLTSPGGGGTVNLVMTSSLCLLVLLVPASLLLPQLYAALGKVRGTLAGLFVVLVCTGGWFLLTRPYQAVLAAGTDTPRASVSSDACFKCHEVHHASWHQTFHRTMTRDASPETVKGDFRDVTYTYQDIPTRLTREGNGFYMETLDQVRSEQMARRGARPGDRSQQHLRKYKVERLVGSHWFQEYLTKDEHGAYRRLPVSYHIVENRWIHTNGAFLSPDTDDFWNKSTVWNESCVFCHNTKPSKQPHRQPWGDHRMLGYDTEVAELGIACEACHGPGAEHVHLNQNLARRYMLQRAGGSDPTIVNPKRLPMQRADDICAHCHGGLVPKPEAWDLATVTDPFNAGDDLSRFNHFFWSEAEQMQFYPQKGSGQGSVVPGAVPASSHENPKVGEADGRFWGDGTALTTAVEYQGMARSACYEGGHGKLSCLSCHSMHDSKPNFLLARNMETNEACYQCHDSYRERLVEHTHHAAGSTGSHCYNCHMPYVVYSLLTTHRSHRIEGLRIKDSLGTGKPHACNLCHLDKSLGWTQDRLQQWYGCAPEPLPEEERTFSSTLLHLYKSDARSRVVVAGAFSWPAAHAASGTASWAGPILAHVLEKERYPAVRYLGYRGLRAIHGNDVGAYDYLAAGKDRSVQINGIRDRLAALLSRPPTSQTPSGREGMPTRLAYPYLPLDDKGQPIEAVLHQLLQKRNDPDVYIHE